MVRAKEWEKTHEKSYLSALEDENVDTQRAQWKDAEKNKIVQASVSLVLLSFFFFQFQDKKEGLGLHGTTECQLFIHKKDASLGHEQSSRLGYTKKMEP